MAWMQPNDKRIGPPKHKHLGAWFISAAVVLCAVVVVMFVLRHDDAECLPDDEGKTKTVKPPKVKPKVNVTARRTNIEKPVAVGEKPVEPSPVAAPVPKTYVDEAGVERYEGGLRVYKGGGDRSELFPNRRRLFKHISEVQISHLFTIKPGATVFGTKKYDKRFVDDFVKSLDEPLLYDEDDTAADRELRKLVHEAKQELKSAYERGEDIAKIMTDSRNELVKLGSFRHAIEKMLQEESGKPETTEEDIKNFIQTANKALEEKGAAPIGKAILTRHIVRAYLNQKKKGSTK